MNQGGSRQQTAYRQKQGVGVPQDATTGRLHSELSQEALTRYRWLELLAPKVIQYSSVINSKQQAQLFSTHITLAYVPIICLLDACKY